MKKLNVCDFYGQEYTEEEILNLKHKGEIAGAILITPTQKIMVYTEEKLDLEGNMQPGLGRHSDAFNNIISNIYGFYPNNNEEAKAFVQNNVVGGIDNFIEIRLVNLLKDGVKYAHVSIPAYINCQQYQYLMEFGKQMGCLNVPVYACLNQFDVKEGTKNLEEPRKSFELLRMLEYIVSNKKIDNDVFIKNAPSKEITFNNYDDGLQSNINFNVSKLVIKK